MLSDKSKSNNFNHKESTPEINKNQQAYPSALDEIEDLEHWSNDPTKWTIPTSPNDSQRLKPSCAAFPDEDEEREDEDCCKSAPSLLEEILPDHDSITAHIPVQKGQPSIHLPSEDRNVHTNITMFILVQESKHYTESA